ncbi:MAG: oligopeptide:H+ symporter [Candidatus Sumerlaeota bacterium]|nr:oligopeptide:H+ symporter [Candidatus Sumerlaeota bacterium]
MRLIQPKSLTAPLFHPSMNLPPSTHTQSPPQAVTLFGHPTGLYTLFFAEMWERFSFYGMRALLVLYMLKGFLKYQDNDAYIVYGAYTALVYMTPFFGGMLADRLLGARRAVIFGGLLMAVGHLTMGIQNYFAFYAALALLICGNGFFKPNISTMVGALYPADSPKRDGGFTIFYMGINLGAAIAPLLCGYIGETYGWHKGFGLASIGMLTGLAVFVMPTLITQIVVMAGAVAAAAGLFYFRPDNPYSVAFNVFVAVSLLIAGVVAMAALRKEGLPKTAGAPPDREILRKPLLGPLSREWAVYGGTLFAVACFALLVSGFSLFTKDHRALTLISDTLIKSLQESSGAIQRGLAVVLKDVSRPAGLIMILSGLIAVGYLGVETFRLKKIARERMFVVLILTFFSMLFMALFEQAGSSMNNFTDRNVDRVLEKSKITPDQVGTPIMIQPTQEQLGLHNGAQMFTLDMLDKLREQNKDNPAFEIAWTVAADNVGMGLADRAREIPTSTFQAINPMCILIFGLVFTALWGFLGARGVEPGTPVKFAMGLLQLGLGFGALWYGAKTADTRGMVALVWLILGYWLHTTGELCLSPVGLSMITKLSPARLVSTVMGAWFLASAFAQLLASTIAQFTSVEGIAGGDSGAVGAAAIIPIPKATVHIYGNVFGNLALGIFVVAIICFALSPLLTRWTHKGFESEGA